MRFPHRLEAQYAARLLRRLHVARTLTLERVLGAAVRLDNEPLQSAVGFGISVRAIIQAVRRVFSVGLPAVSPESLGSTALAVDSWATGQVTRAVEKVVGVDVEGVTRVGSTRLSTRQLHLEWARENVELIRTMEANTFDDLAKAITEAVVEGRTDLAEVIQRRFGVAESRAKLIARDQIAKLNGRITQSRQQALGVQHYEWSTSGDQRVRPAHRKLHGTIRRWDDPHPTERHPGQSIACRCVALPVLDPPDAPTPTAAPPPKLPTLPRTFGGLPTGFGDPTAAPGSIYVPGARVDKRTPGGVDP